jgi:quinol monooxygenase YgiN
LKGLHLCLVNIDKQLNLSRAMPHLSSSTQNQTVIITFLQTAGIILAFALCISSANAQNNNSRAKNNLMLALLVTFRVKPEQRELLKTALLEDVRNAKTEKGNITMELYEHRDQPNTFYLFERWGNQVALDLHFEKPYTRKVLELNKTALREPMEILYLNDLAPLPQKEMKKPLTADTPVDLVVIFKVKDGMQERFIQQFQKSVENSRPEAGNIAFHFHTVEGDNTKFVLYERWRNQASLDFHFAQPYTKELFELFKTALAKPVDESLNFMTEIGNEKQLDK